MMFPGFLICGAIEISAVGVCRSAAGELSGCAGAGLPATQRLRPDHAARAIYPLPDTASTGEFLSCAARTCAGGADAPWLPDSPDLRSAPAGKRRPRQL